LQDTLGPGLSNVIMVMMGTRRTDTGDPYTGCSVLLPRGGGMGGRREGGWGAGGAWALSSVTIVMEGGRCTIIWECEGTAVCFLGLDGGCCLQAGQ
jgi:hypothetical protein